MANATSLEVRVSEREQEKAWLTHVATDLDIDPKPDLTVINRDLEFLQVHSFFFSSRGALAFMISFFIRGQNIRLLRNLLRKEHNVFHSLNIFTTKTIPKH
jgi:hypothetical protein